MLHILHAAEAKLNELLADTNAWGSKKIDYTPPVVDRLYRDWVVDGVTYRVNLHKVYPCDEAFFHPHPWPSAVRVLPVPGSTYEMAVGYGAGLDDPPRAMLLRLPGGTEYEMVEPNGWHSVRVVGAPSYSLMVTGPIWDRQVPRPTNLKLRSLIREEIDELRFAMLNYTTTGRVSL